MVTQATTRAAGPSDAPPSYDDIDNAPWNKQITALFRRKMIAKIGEDTEEAGYDGIISLTRKLNNMHAGTSRILGHTYTGHEWLYLSMLKVGCCIHDSTSQNLCCHL